MNTMDIPKIFWKYYDLYRRKILSLDEFQQLSGICKETIVIILNEIETETQDDFLRNM